MQGPAARRARLADCVFATAVLALSLTSAGAASDPPVQTVDTSFQNVLVKPGDTLWSISHAYLKDPAKWSEILKHNRLPTADPTVALPGMTLRVPVRLIKAELRAAHLVYRVNQVLRRSKNTADWKETTEAMEVYAGDTLRTLEASRARVKFLNKELLNLEPNSMAVIKPQDDPDADVVLRQGSVFAGRARVVTASARVTPRTRDTRYAASVEPDMSTRVQVFKGVAGVEAQGSDVDVHAGMETRVMPGLAPEVPKPLENPPELEAKAAEFDSAVAIGGGAAVKVRDLKAPEPEADAAVLRGDIDSLHVGIPILGYHIQAAADREFKNILFNRKYDSDERFYPQDTGLAAGAYWWRASMIDLLGTEASWSEPRYYSIGAKRVEAAANANGDFSRLINIVTPEEGFETDKDNVRFAGVLRDDRLRLDYGGKPVRVDADGNFVVTVPLVMGLNTVDLTITDGKGNTTRVMRRVTRR